MAAVIHFQDRDVTLHSGGALTVLPTLPDASVHCVVTSPPYYGLRDYGHPDQLGLEATPMEYVDKLAAICREVWRVLRDDGTFWLVLGDSYVSKPPGNVRGVSDRSGLHGAQTSEKYRDTLTRGMGSKRDTTGFGLPQKSLIGVPWRVAFALMDDGWILRNEIIWHKGNPMPESVQDRLSSTHEHLFLFVKSRRYYFDLAAIKEPLIFPELADGSRIFGGKHGGEGKVGSSRRTGGGMPNAWGTQQNLTPRHQAATDNTGWKQHKPEPSPDGRNPGDVWMINTTPYPDAHFATFPPKLARQCILAGSGWYSTVLDPFVGSGTTCKVARSLGRNSIGIDLNPEYLDLAIRRIGDPTLDFSE